MPYSPTYSSPPLVDFQSVMPETSLESLNLNWREQDLPERLRTKHVHRLHPYLGKFIPQLVEVFLRKYRSMTVCDPFCGCGTTLVEANALGINSIGCDISSFNCLLSKVKTDEYDVGLLEHEVKDILGQLHLRLKPGLFFQESDDIDNEYLRAWFAPRARKQLLYFRSLIPNYHYQNVLKIILSRAARSARLTTHFDLDFPKEPQLTSYYCYKHGRTCHPTDNALQFLTRYSLDTLNRIKEFAQIRTKAGVTVIHGDVRDVQFPEFDCVITSPPYVGLIDYHEQHRYAYELLGLPRNEELEIGAAYKGNSQRAKTTYRREIEQAFANVKRFLGRGGIMVIVVNDKYGLYDDMASKLGFEVEGVLHRNVNRRTGRRADDFFESILVWRQND
jgi:DNA modification methylase